MKAFVERLTNWSDSICRRLLVRGFWSPNTATMSVVSVRLGERYCQWIGPLILCCVIGCLSLSVPIERGKTAHAMC